MLGFNLMLVYSHTMKPHNLNRRSNLRNCNHFLWLHFYKCYSIMCPLMRIARVKKALHNKDRIPK